MIWILISVAVAALIAAYLRRHPTNINSIPRIPFSSYLSGHVKHLFDNCFGDCLIGWTNEYGHTYVLESILREPYIHTIDKGAINHVLQKKAQLYTKPSAIQNVMRKVFGRDGIFIAEGQQHKKLRKLMTPSFFTASNLQNFIPIIQQKSTELIDIFSDKKTVQFDILQDIKNASTDMVGIVGFGFSFDLLSPNKERTQRQIELHEALQIVIASASRASIVTALALFIKSITIIPTRTFKLMDRAMSLFEQVGLDLMNEKKEVEKQNEEIGEDSFQGKDVLSLLMKSNLSPDLNPSDKLSTSEVVSQIATFLMAGTDTTSNAMAYLMHSLASNPRVQDKLRSEIIENALNMNETISLSDVNSLHYLDLVIKETLRLNAPVPLTVRQATQADVIPLANPVKDPKTGEMISQIVIKPGQKVVIGIHSYNKSELMWDNPLEFIPERYEKDIHSPPYMSFIEGQRVCIGYKLAILEMKIMTINLIKNFVFTLPDPPHTIVKTGRMVHAPWIGERMDLGTRLELQVTEYKL